MRGICSFFCMAMELHFLGLFHSRARNASCRSSSHSTRDLAFSRYPRVGLLPTRHVIWLFLAIHVSAFFLLDT